MAVRQNLLALFFVLVCFVAVSYGAGTQAQTPATRRFDFSMQEQREGFHSLRSKSSSMMSKRDNSNTCYNFWAPQPNNALNGRACCWYASSTCCSGAMNSTLVDQILNMTEISLTVALSEFNNTVNSCYLTMAELTCNFCAPDTSFLSLDSDSFTLTLCNSYCSKIFTSCSPYQAQLGITGNFTDPTKFCKKLFEVEEQGIPSGGSGDDSESGSSRGLRFNVKFSNSNCFNGASESLDQLSCEGCIPGTVPCSSGPGWKIVLIIILVATVVLAVGAFFFFRWRKSRQNVTIQGSNRFSEFADE